MGKPRTVKYGDYEVNYGMIPGTSYSYRLGGDGDMIDAIVLGKKIKRGKKVKVMPIGIMRMTDFGKNDFKIVSVIYEDYKKSNNISEKLFKSNYDEIEKLRVWFENYKGNNIVKFLSYGNGKEAYDLIKLASIEFKKNGIRPF